MKAKKSIKKIAKKVSKPKSDKKVLHIAKHAKVPLAKKSPYTATVSLNEQNFMGHGKSLLDALNAIVVPKMMIKTKVVLFVAGPKKSIEQVIMGMQLRRILGGKVAKEIWAKRLESRMI